ncbi:OLC1v1029020C1 [Oldenlandia corymbosa var. corymbosa]|uniref:OLC1v1029020C1 n=1 Tax=Oldenlandia corymbosa var. corymbosa TaxID=529605 RepID=A0AAV1CET2_OLDCO|nr:OLC1v1029020C1 [Oldenlandia corymbosa var. corymbosa]
MFFTYCSGFSFAKRSSNQKLSSLFPSISVSNDKDLPPIETPNHRYWRCPECSGLEIERAGVQLGTPAEVSLRPVGTNSGIQQVLVPENTEGTQCVGTNAGMQQVLVPENTEDVQSIGTDLGLQLASSEGTSEDIRHIGTISGIQHSSLIRISECIQSIGTNIGKLQGQTAPSTESMKSIVANISASKNAVEFSALLPNTPEIISAEAVDISHTGDKDAPIEPVVDGVEKLADERIKTKTSRLTVGGVAEAPAEKVNTNSGHNGGRGGLHKSTNRKRGLTLTGKDKVTSVEGAANGMPGKNDETENDRGRENENSNGPRRKVRKVRLLTDLLGDQGNSTMKTAEKNLSTSTPLLEPVGSGNAVVEGQVGSEKDAAKDVQSPKKKAKVSREGEDTNDPSNVPSNVKANKKDTGKAIMVIDIPDSDDVETVPSGGEGLFIGTKTERLRRRSEITPPVSKKKSKPTEVLDFSVVRSLPASSVTGRWGSHPSAAPRDQNHVGLLSAGLNGQPSFNKSTRVGLDLSLGSFSTKNNSLDTGSKAFLKKDDVLFGKSNALPTAELKKSCSKGQSLDLNERAAVIPYNSETNNFPIQRETEFLNLGLKEKSINHGKSKESDQRADEFPMDIVELLAKQQHDKKNNNDVNRVVQRLPNRGDAPLTMDDVVRSFGLHAIPLVDTPRGASVASENGRKQQGNPVPFAHMSKNNMKLFQTEGNHKSIYTSSAQNQQKTSSGIQISPSASVRAGLHHNQVREPILSSTSSKQTFGFGIQQKQAAEHHKGKTISDIKLDELKKSEEARFIYKSGDSAVGSKAKGPSDAYKYNNESIPALQLLSLMDGGSSDTAFSLGTTKFPSKPFSPCSYHPRFSRDERQDLTSGSLFLRQSLTKEPPTLGPALSSYQSSRPHSAASSMNIYLLAASCFFVFISSMS